MKKLLQLHTYYPHYVQMLYRRSPQLFCASSEQQVAAALADGYGAVHMMTPYLRELGYDAQLVFGNCLYSQSKWLEENRLTINSSSNWQQDIARLQIETFKPDIIYATDAVTFDSRFLSTVQWQPQLVVGWRGAPAGKETDWSSFDLMLSHLTVFRNNAIERGAKAAEFFFPGFPRPLADAVAHVPKQYDVVFSGQWSAHHSRRNAYVEAVVREAETSGAFTVGLFLMAPSKNLPPLIKKFNQGQLFGMDMYRALRAGRIVINAEADFAGGEAGNMRLFEATGAGSFLLTESLDNINDYFNPGTELEIFRDARELIDKIYFYLRHAEEREKIAAQGQARCLTGYGMENRASALDMIIRKHLNGKTSLKAQVYVAQAIDELNDGNIEMSLHLLNKAKSFDEAVEGLEYYRAQCLLLKKMPGDACEALRKELELFPANRDARHLLSKLCA